jgi:hypothetical protein
VFHIHTCIEIHWPLPKQPKGPSLGHHSVKKNILRKLLTQHRSYLEIARFTSTWRQGIGLCHSRICRYLRVGDIYFFIFLCISTQFRLLQATNLPLPPCYYIIPNLKQLCGNMRLYCCKVRSLTLLLQNLFVYPRVLNKP